MNQEAIRGTQHARMKAETQEQRQGVEAVGGDEHTTEYKKLMEQEEETLRRNTQDNRFLAKPVESKHN